MSQTSVRHGTRAERSRCRVLDPFPNDANYRKLKVHLEITAPRWTKFKEELKNEVAPGPPWRPNEFQSPFAQAVIATPTGRTRTT